jgi:endonuclease/exonuclease/phosphatase family metal-dependent hydrolase
MTGTKVRSILILLFVLAFCGCKPNRSELPQAENAAEKPGQAETVAAATPLQEKPVRELSKPATVQTIRIVAWNLQWFPGHKPEPAPTAEAEHMESAKAAVAQLKPDVLLLEEARDWESAAELCKVVPNLEVHVVSHFEARPQNQAVASKFPADSAWSDSWESGVITPPRGYSFAALKLPGHRFLLTYALHLKSNLGTLSLDIRQRQAAAKQLLRHVNEMLVIYRKQGPCAVVLGGDLNTSMDDPKFSQDQTIPALIKAGFHWTFEGVPFAERTTIPAKGGFADNCFDHVLTAGLGKPLAAVQSFAGISDHNPVVMDVDLASADFQPQIDENSGVALLDQPMVREAAAPTTPLPVTATLDAGDTEAITAAVGKVIAVRGRVQNVAATKTNSIHFINFGENEKGSFVGIVRQGDYDAVAAGLGADLDSGLSGKNVELRGEIVLYKEAPEIIVSNPNQIRVLDR